MSVYFSFHSYFPLFLLFSDSSGYKLNSNLNNQNVVSTGLTLSWGSVASGGYTVIGNLVIINIRITTNTALNASIDYSIYGFPYLKVSTSNTVAVSSARYDLTSNCYFNTQGILVFNPSVTVTSGTALLFSAFYIKQ